VLHRRLWIWFYYVRAIRSTLITVTSATLTLFSHSQQRHFASSVGKENIIVPIVSVCRQRQIYKPNRIPFNQSSSCVCVWLPMHICRLSRIKTWCPDHTHVLTWQQFGLINENNNFLGDAAYPVLVGLLVTFRDKRASHWWSDKVQCCTKCPKICHWLSIIVMAHQ